jgi:hypothetical protein
MSDFTAKASHLAVVLRNTGTHATPVYVTWSGARDISQNSRTIEAHEAAGRARTAKGYIKGRFDHNLVIQAPVNYGDANWLAAFDSFAAAADNNTSLIYIATITGAIATVGTTGVRGFYLITEMSEPYPIDGVMFTDFTFKPAAHADDLTNVKVTA